MTGLSRPDRAHSLRWRLLFAVCLVVLLTWGLTGVLTHNKALHEAEELMDGNLAQRAHLLLALLRDNEDALDGLGKRLTGVRPASDNVYEPPLEFQFGRADGTILLRSDNAPELPITGAPGYSDILRQKASWRILNMISPDGRYRVQVAQSIDVRDQAALEVASQAILPVALILPVFLLLLYVSIRRGLRPLDQLATDVAARGSDNLSSLPNGTVPTEVRPLVAALNRLFYRVGLALENERRFTADAAHELRTPLAALKIQAQVARLSEQAQARGHALRQIEAGVERATHLVEQLLRLARLDPLSNLPSPQPFDLAEVIRDMLATIDAERRAKHRIVATLPDTALVASGDPALMAIAIRNLVDNAMRYTPPDSTITIDAGEDAGGLSLAVSDDGPGVSPVDLPRLGERFYRSRETATEGNGLGLAIVARIAELHGARLACGNQPTGGFVARIVGLTKNHGQRSDKPSVGAIPANGGKSPSRP
ncbi:MAG: sensor histidine kinase N-terminal domain-containing protein [Rhodocyclaceae bacterium]|nr:sensor histidine kinase N-terminal domain-containing protein [Rhodocyclaceae bacterium]